MYPQGKEDELARDLIIKLFRNKKMRNPNFTMRLLSSKCDINQGTISSYMAGKRKLNLESIEKILFLLDASPKEIERAIGLTREYLFKLSQKS